MPTLPAFIARWRASGAAERANFQQFALELCDLLEVPRPDPTGPDDAHNAYVFERSVPLPGGTTGRIDLYKRGCFIMEAKQGRDGEDQTPALTAAAAQRRRQAKRGTARRGTGAWDTAMEKARNQAQSYARSLPAGEVIGGRPPFLITVDVGNSLALYAEFTRTGGHYVPFPDPQSYRLSLDDLARPDSRDRLRRVWLDPLSLDPARRSAAVTRDIAARLAELAKSLEREHPPEAVAHFLMRCLFTMFAEDVDLLPNRSFTQLLADLQRDPPSLQPMLEHLWQTMSRGGFSVILRRDIPHFNGGLFESPAALPLTAGQIQLLLEAAQADWRHVEPAIFGALLERALDPVERHHLGAHYTPRAYVERLVQPAVIEPLRAEWDAVQAAALRYTQLDEVDKAVAEVTAFQRRLATVRILDPACGSGNFLYVTLELLKRLEGEVLNILRALGQSQLLLEMESVMVTPRQFLGLEVNPRAAAIAELVLWIGFLQWHFRTRGQVQPPTPIIQSFHNIERRDAVLAWDATQPRLDAAGQPVTRWDGRTTRPHPVTGAAVPDEHARLPVLDYLNPRPAGWPAADFVVGNPPFIGAASMREALGDGYAEAIRRAYPTVPDSADYVMYWWDKAATLTRAGQLERFGFIATNSLRQTFNRRVLQHHLQAQPSLALAFAIPDHPWVDSADGAAVRISMTVGVAGRQPGELRTVTAELPGRDDSREIQLAHKRGLIQADLTIGADVTGAVPLQANQNISSRGVQLIGGGFIVEPEEAGQLGLGRVPGLEKHLRLYRNGRDLTATPREVMVIDLFGLSESEVKQRFPEVYQWVYERVKPERDQNRRAGYRRNWWIHGEARANFRPALAGLGRYIATVETSKHRFFVFLDASILPDNMLVNIALDDAYALGVLSSRVHVTWALAAGGRLGVGNDPRYNKTRCFETFPFPAATESRQARIRDLGEQLDAHRRRQQALHPKLTMTDMYNVLDKLRAGAALGVKEQQVHAWGLVSLLRQLHDDLDAAVAEAYGWPLELSDDEILTRLVALNAARAAEEAAGQIRWLRPAYQAPDVAPVVTQAALLDAGTETPIAAPAEKPPWPASLAEQAQAVRTALAALAGPVTAETLNSHFAGSAKARQPRLTELLETLVMLGQAGRTADGRYVATS